MVKQFVRMLTEPPVWIQLVELPVINKRSGPVAPVPASDSVPALGFRPWVQSVSALGLVSCGFGLGCGFGSCRCSGAAFVPASAVLASAALVPVPGVSVPGSASVPADCAPAASAGVAVPCFCLGSCSN